jgi:hypothetical protein
LSPTVEHWRVFVPETLVVPDITVRRSSAVPTACAIAFVILVQASLAIYRTRHSYFVTDDFLNFMIYKDMGLTWKYLFRDIFGHITPLYRLVQAVMLVTNHINFAALRVLMIGTALLPTALLILLGNRLRVPLQVSTASALLLAALPQISQSEFWWSNGLLVLPGLTAIFLCFWLLVGRTGAGPNHRECALATLAFVVGLGFYDKDLFAPVIFFGLLTSLHMRNTSVISAAWRALFDLRYIIAASIIWAITLAVLRDPSPPAPTIGVAMRFMWLAWSEATVAAMLGIGEPGRNVGGAFISGLVAEAILAASICWTILRGRRSDVRPVVIWAGIMVYVAVTIALTARMRAGVFGADLGRLLRYAVEPAAFIVAGVVMASGERGRKPWLAACAIIGVAVNVMVVSDVPLLGDPIGTRAYVANLRASYAKIAGTSGVVVLDRPVPENIMPPWMSPYNVQSHFLPLLGLTQYQIAGPSTATYYIDVHGSLQSRK